MPTLRRRITLPVPAAEAFAWHERPGALQRLSPPWAPVEVEQAPDGLDVGTRVVLRTGIGPIRPRWVAEHVAYDPPHEFRDVQRSGPFAVWDHRHRFADLAGSERSDLTDDVTYRLPLESLLPPAIRRLIDQRIEQMFAFRHDRTLADLSAHARYRKQPRMRIAITGASGMIGSAMSAFLTTGGHEVIPMVRRPARPGEIRWDPLGGTVESDKLRGVDALIHLAADPIRPRPMTAGQRRAFRDSRVVGTRTIATALAGLDDGPRILLTASGSNIYGDRGDEILTETSTPGTTGFLTELTRDWEDAAGPAHDAGIRVVLFRTGIVLDRSATVLKAMGLVTRLGAVAPVGSGRQYWPWVSIDDVVQLYHHALMTPAIAGPFNAASPNPVTNEVFTRTLARVLRRPVLPLRVPGFMPALLLGPQMNASLLLTSMRMRPAKAQATGYEFLHPDLEQALRHLYGR